jgi:protein-arginine kinase activator protein McsA
MTNSNKAQIQQMRENGCSYAQIASALDMSINTVKSFWRREQEKKLYCRNCGKRLEQIPKQKPRIFCSTPCRMNWWRHNRDKLAGKAYYHLTCQNCSAEFTCYGNKNRKYCSHNCYIQSRFGGRGVP